LGSLATAATLGVWGMVSADDAAAAMDYDGSMGDAGDQHPIQTGEQIMVAESDLIGQNSPTYLDLASWQNVDSDEVAERVFDRLHDNFPNHADGFDKTELAQFARQFNSFYDMNP
jgi:hypothetical protein